MCNSFFKIDAQVYEGRKWSNVHWIWCNEKARK